MQEHRAVPTIFRHGPYRFFFYSNDGEPLEPPHIHVVAGRKIARFWLEPVKLSSTKYESADTRNQPASQVHRISARQVPGGLACARSRLKRNRWQGTYTSRPTHS